MRPTKHPNSDGPGEPPVPVRFALGASLVVLIAIVMAVTLTNRPKPAPHAPAPSAAQAEALDVNPPPATPLPVVAPARALPAPTTPVLAATPPSGPVSPELLTPAQLVDELAAIGSGPVTPEQAARFKQDLNELIRRGSASVPAIQELLKQNTDVAYGDVAGGDQLGYSSLRASLIDTLSRIGGPDAQAAMVAAMNTTANPSELLQLAQDLDRQAPGQYRDQIVSGAEQTLQMAASGQINTNAEVGPAFRTVQNFSGGANTTAQTAQNDPADFYSAVTLANLPDGQGLAALLQMQQSSSGASQVIATTMIAQMAGQNGDALDALAQLAQNGQISQNEWVQLAPILGGNQYQMDPSGQSYTVSGGASSPDQINQRISLIDAMMNYVPSGTGGAKALQQELITLNTKLGSN